MTHLQAASFLRVRYGDIYRDETSPMLPYAR